MELSELVWGVLVLAAGVFISVYGQMLFRYVLAAIGLTIGFQFGMIVTDGQSDGVRILVSLAIGGFAAAVLYGLVRFGIYVAGAILGSVVALIVSALLGISTGGQGIIGWIILIVGVAGGGILGPRFGEMIVAFATAAAGSYLIVSGLTILFASQLDSVVTDPSLNFAPWLTLVVFAAFVAVSTLAQINIHNLRQRLLRR